MKKRIFLNLVIGISLIATPAFLLASCSAQASDVKLQITAKATPGIITVHEVKAESITFTTVQKLFDIAESDFVNVKATLKNTNVGVNQTNQVVLTANEGFVFEGGAGTLDSAIFNLSKQLEITAKTLEEAASFIPYVEISASPIALSTIQKLFNITQSDFENVTVSLTEEIVPGMGNQIVLTAKKGFIFKNGTNTLLSEWFTIQGKTSK